MTPKKYLLIPVLVLFSLFITPISTAAPKCFENIPDSAWANGVPQEVQQSLNFELAQTVNDPLQKSRSIKQMVFSPYTQSSISLYRNYYYFVGGNPYTITYQYSGKNCESRTVNVNVDLISMPKFYSLDDLDKVLKETSENFIIYQERVQSLESLKKYLQDKIVNFPIASKWTTSGSWYFNKTVRSNFDYEYFSKTIEKLGSNANRFNLFVQPDSSCISMSPASSVWEFPSNLKLTGVNLGNSWPNTITFINKNNKKCPVNYYLELNQPSPFLKTWSGAKTSWGAPDAMGFELATGYFQPKK